MYIHICIYIYVYTYMYIHIYIYRHIHICMYMHTDIHVYIYEYVHTYITDVYMYTHTTNTKPVAVSFQTFSVLQVPIIFELNMEAGTARLLARVCLVRSVHVCKVFLCKGSFCRLAGAGFFALVFLFRGSRARAISSCRDPGPSFSSACRPQSYGRCCCGPGGGEQRVLGVHSGPSCGCRRRT